MSSDAASQTTESSHQAGQRDPAKRPLGRIIDRLLRSTPGEHEMALRGGSIVGAIGGLAWTLNLFSGATIGIKTLTFFAGVGTMAGAGLGIALPGLVVGCVMLHQEKIERARLAVEQAKERAARDARLAEYDRRLRENLAKEAADKAAGKTPDSAKPADLATTPESPPKPPSDCPAADCPMR